MTRDTFTKSYPEIRREQISPKIKVSGTTNAWNYNTNTNNNNKNNN